MRLNRLRGVRITVSAVFFGIVVLMYLDLRQTIAPAVGSTVLYLQFIPSLLKFLQTATLGGAGFLVVIGVTLLCGRVYCSTVCPLGVLQDIAGAAPLLRQRKNRRRFRRAHNGFRYTVLFMSAAMLLAGSGLLVNLLDPYSIFGRIFANLVRPMVIEFNNYAAAVLERGGFYALTREQWLLFAPLSCGISAAMLLLVWWLGARHGRLYCNTCCPVGALLGLAARISLVRLHISETNCRTCHRCEASCKADCIDLDRNTVDMSRCVGCCNCLAVCPHGAIGVTVRWREDKRDGDLCVSGRREFLFSSGRFFLGLAGLSGEIPLSNSVRAVVASRPTKIPEMRTSPVSPPGSGSCEHFTATCTACHLCVSTCPAQVLLPSFLDYGVAGIMQPKMAYHGGHCTYECTLCMVVCPTGALRPLAVDEKKLTQLGVATFIKENCVVYTDNTACGACSEHCPTKAVTMVPYANPLHRPLTIPEVKADYCIGCGGCEHACPTRPFKAIFVNGNPQHKRAKTPEIKTIAPQSDGQRDFPF